MRNRCERLTSALGGNRAALIGIVDEELQGRSLRIVCRWLVASAKRYMCEIALCKL